MVETCDTETADGCCGVISCDLCLEWETYADGISYGSAHIGTSSWTGTVGGHSFVSYWERNYESGECEYVVTLDGEEVYRATCYEGASCRDPRGEVSVATAYLEGTLRWSVYERRELALAVNPETGCRDFFCGSCRCSCDCLCVTITEYGGDVITGEICDTAYECDPPVWAGAVGYYELSIALGRDQYGECIITLTIDGEEQEAVAAPGCGSLAATITTAGGDVIQVRCKECGCEETQVIGDCICGRPLGPTLTLLWSSGNGTHGSASREVTLTYQQFDEPGITCPPFSPDPFPAYVGSVSGTFPLPMGGERADTLHIVLVCGCIGCELCLYYYWEDGGAAPGYFLTTISETDCNCPAIFDGGAFTDGEVWGYQISDITITEDESNC